MIYSGRGFKDWEIGDIEVIVHEGVYHLYHLIIPNHDYIAHAVSKDGINWRRVKNAIFVGDPGEWDDDMIWTMDVSPTKDGFVMYYTGLSMADEGKTQRVGRAYSSDLILWTKDDRGALVESQGPYYEDLTNNPRGWLSFRDPYQYSHEGQNYLLICGRASAGATHHRGCVTIVREEADGFQLLPPLLYPGLYDDVECPCLVHIKDRFYLLGSIREDIKVRYWHSKDFLGPYESFHSDMLMPGGNYAARVVQDGDHMLLYNFYFSNKDLNHKRVLPPPKELDVDVDGKLYMKTYYRWVDMITDTVTQDKLPNLESRLQNHTSDSDIRPDSWTLSSISGYQIYSFARPGENIIWHGRITLEGMGKCGFVLNEDGEGNAYYISLDFVNGYVRIRTWGFNPEDMTQDFIFKKLQSNLFKPNADRSHRFQLIYYRNYIELSIDDQVQLTLVDETFREGNLGFYVASAKIVVSEIQVSTLVDDQTRYAEALMA